MQCMRELEGYSSQLYCLSVTSMLLTLGAEGLLHKFHAHAHGNYLIQALWAHLWGLLIYLSCEQTEVNIMHEVHW